MRDISDLNVTNIERGRFGDLLGDGNQHFVAGILMRLGFEEVAISDVGRSPYDIVMKAYKYPGEPGNLIRIQTRTVSKDGSISFMAGLRAGIDREYKTGVKEYKFTEEHNDLIIGVGREKLDLYLIPTRYLKHWGKSKRISALSPLKNNWDILLNWNDRFLENLWKKLKAGI